MASHHVDSSRVLSDKGRSGTPYITCDRSSNQHSKLHSTITKNNVSLVFLFDSSVPFLSIVYNEFW